MPVKDAYFILSAVIILKKHSEEGYFIQLK